MKSSYSIEKVGNEYVVKVDNQSVMTVGNRRKAERLVAEASSMLGQTAATGRGPDNSDRPGEPS